MNRWPRQAKQLIRYSAGIDSDSENLPNPEVAPWPWVEPPESFADSSDDETDEPVYVFEDAPAIVDGIKGILRSEDAPPNQDRKVHFSKETVEESDAKNRQKKKHLLQIYAAANDSPMINQTDFLDDVFPEFSVVPYYERPPSTDLEFHAIALNYCSFLSAAAGSAEPQQQMNNFLIFMNFYCANLQRFVEAQKPMRSFPGETYDVDKLESHEFKAILEQVKTDTVAMHVIGNGWTLTHYISTLAKGNGFLGGGSFAIGTDEEIGYTFKTVFCQMHYSEAEQRHFWFQKGDVSASSAFSDCIGKLFFNDDKEQVLAKSYIQKETTQLLFKGTQVGKMTAQYRHELMADGRLDRRMVTKVNPVGRAILKQFLSGLQQQPTNDLPASDSRNREDIMFMKHGEFEEAENCYYWLCDTNQYKAPRKPRYFICRNVNDEKFYEFKQGSWGPSYFELKEQNFVKAVKRRRVDE
uniref:Uncharacterized protein n=1 Tax=Panagrellus redivivus TaxID=6233 RepID=A0A7E4VT67_PANRE